MPDLSCHRQAIISALRDRGGDARTQLSSRLPSSPLFPIVLAAAAQAPVTCHRPEGAGKAAPRDAGCTPIHPGLWMGLSAQLLPQQGLIHGVGRGMGGELPVPAQPLRPLSGCQPYFMGLFPSLASPEGAWVSPGQGCYQQGHARRKMPHAQTVEGAGTRGKGQSPFISDSNLSKKLPGLCHIFIPPASPRGTGGLALIAPGCGERRSEHSSSLLSLACFLLTFLSSSPPFSLPSLFHLPAPIHPACSAVSAASSLPAFAFKCLQRSQSC